MSYKFFRNLLFKLDPETAHYLSLESLKIFKKFCSICGYHAGAQEPEKIFESKGSLCYTYKKTVMGLNFPNPVGLAAGMDKNGDYIDALGSLGFGFLEIGTVTPRAQVGNPKPRLFRLPKAEAVINRMGFNNKGVDYVVSKLKQSQFPGIIGVNIGKNFDTPIEKAYLDYLICLRKIYPYAHYVTVNISSPNTPNLRQLQFSEDLKLLLESLKNEQKKLTEKHGRYVPLLVKIAPDLSEQDLESIAEILITMQIDGVIATNTTISRNNVKGLKNSKQEGGLSGKPLREKSTNVVRILNKCLNNKMTIIASGGIMNVEDAQEKITAGADLVQLYTGLIYRGPGLVNDINKKLKMKNL
ncbi:dihydroorotate dehydrogenase, type 2 [Candidatus Magnetomoraceae bacterium gMMP-15]